MIPVYQDKFAHIHGTGNCQNACIASLLELPLREVDDILPTDPGDWHKRWNVWLAEKGYKLVLHLTGESDDKIPEGYAIASVMTSRVFPEGHERAGKSISHAVIVFNGKLVHDPYPTGTEIQKINYYQTLEKLNVDERKIHRFEARKGLCLHGYLSTCKICNE